jgi:lysozyme
MSPAQRVAAVMAAAALAVPFISKWEGWAPVAYRDPAPAGYVTACYGNRTDAVLGRTYTEEDCARLLAQDAIAHGLEIDRCIPANTPFNARAAFTSLAFNIGAAQFCSSTLARKLNAGDVAGACAEISRWTKAGGRVLPGLVSRRTDERKLCEQGLKQ